VTVESEGILKIECMHHRIEQASSELSVYVREQHVHSKSYINVWVYVERDSWPHSVTLPQRGASSGKAISSKDESKSRGKRTETNK
jgi:hypothetical protein